MRQEQDFDGFVAPGGELVSIEDVDRMLSIIAKRTENRDEVVGMLWGLARECSDGGHSDAADAYFEKILALVDSPGAKAECLLAMGQARERSGDHKAALDTYAGAFELPQEPNPVWYFLHNNCGYCLNQAGQYQEAEMHCRAAIGIDPGRQNGHKNLGVALQGQGRYCDAARSFILATMACPQDGRALGLLEELVAAQPEILEQEHELLDLRLRCHEVAGTIRGKPRFQ